MTDRRDELVKWGRVVWEKGDFLELVDIGVEQDRIYGSAQFPMQLTYIARCFESFSERYRLDKLQDLTPFFALHPLQQSGVSVYQRNHGFNSRSETQYLQLLPQHRPHDISPFGREGRPTPSTDRIPIRRDSITYDRPVMFTLWV